ncbi:RNA recognition motif domain [Dillenia turbinata]|uniref:RNA recognition motif domain n=1 Tax=Dillenia turbinata TaxID=194707 RepID=A0AAN8Z6A5_9MAGN
MAALRWLSGPSSYPSTRRTPSFLFCFRGISSKLFVKARVIKNKVTNRSKGFAYVTFREENEAQQALEEMNGKAVDLE